MYQLPEGEVACDNGRTGGSASLRVSSSVGRPIPVTASLTSLFIWKVFLREDLEHILGDGWEFSM